jgi:hypothetical protein
MNARMIGLGLFVVAAGVAAAFYLFGDELMGKRAARVDAMGFTGGEKRDFVNNPKVQRILADRYGIRFDARKAGSVEMVTDQRLISQKPDLVWPGSTVAVELAKQSGMKIIKDEIIFNSPIVLYSWSPVAKAFVAKGIAKPLNRTGTAYSIDTNKLLDLIRNKTRWSDIGVPSLYGTVMLVSTDPNKSNSGNQFFSLMLHVLADGELRGEKLTTALRELKDVHQRMGYLVHSSSDLFQQYLRTGMGAKPLVAGYESQLIEFAHNNRDIWKGLAGAKIRPVILYPEPTVFSSHVMLALTEKGRKVADAMKDKELQAIAWNQHGFRSGLVSTSDTNALPIQGIPANLGKIVPMPPVSVVNRMLRVMRGEGD